MKSLYLHTLASPSLLKGCDALSSNKYFQTYIDENIDKSLLSPFRLQFLPTMNMLQIDTYSTIPLILRHLASFLSKTS